MPQRLQLIFLLHLLTSSERSRRQQVRRKRPFQNARVRGHALPLCLSFPDSIMHAQHTHKPGAPESGTGISQHERRRSVCGAMTCAPPAERAHGLHRHNMRNALVSLFETPIPQSDATARTVLSKVLGNPAINFDKPLLDFTSNHHLEFLARPGTPSCVWETPAHKAGNTRTVLDPIIHDGHENVIDFIGKHCIPPLALLVCTEAALLQHTSLCWMANASSTPPSFPTWTSFISTSCLRTYSVL